MHDTTLLPLPIYRNVNPSRPLLLYPELLDAQWPTHQPEVTRRRSWCCARTHHSNAIQAFASPITIHDSAKHEPSNKIMESYSGLLNRLLDSRIRGHVPSWKGLPHDNRLQVV